MSIGFLVLAHRYPDQLKDLIESLLRFPSSKIYLHIDKKSELVFSNLNLFFSNNKRVVLLEERYAVYWGSFNQILATLALMRKAYESKTENFFMLVSGQDFPIKKPELVLEFLRMNPARQFVVNFKLPDSQWRLGGLNRLGHYSFDIPGRPWLSNKINAFIERLHIKFNYKRKVNFQQYGGSNWFNINFEALEYIIDFVAKNPSFLKSFRFTRCADEVFVQSILMNSVFRDQVISDDLRYIDWGSGPEYPRILRNIDYDKMLNSKDKFFARKFDTSIDSNILIKLSKHLDS